MSPSAEATLMLQRLRRRGLSYGALAVIADEFYGWKISPNGVRTVLRKLGEPPARKWNGAGVCAK